MNLDIEFRELIQLNNRESYKQISLVISPLLLRDIDRLCKELRFSRGELLSVCFLRVKNGADVVNDNFL